FVTGIALMGAGYAASAVASSLWGILVALLVAAVGVALLATTEVQLLFRYAGTPELETRSYGWMFAVFHLFLSVGTYLGGRLPAILGGRSTPYQGSLLAAGAILLALSLIRARWLPPEPPAPEGGRHRKAFAEAVRPARAGDADGTADRRVRTLFQPFWNLRLWRLGGLSFLSAAAMALVGPLQNVLLRVRFGADDAAVGGLLTAAGLALFAGSLAASRLTEHLGLRWTFTVLFAANVLLHALLIAPLAYAAYGFVFFLRSGAFTMLANLIESQTMSALPDEERDAFAAVRNVLRSIATAGGSAWAGAMLAAGSGTGPYAAGTALMMFAWLYYLRETVREFERPWSTAVRQPGLKER
ncbi:MAG: hypothetical protein KM312_00710, partial [Hydrogenibacillus schlegelii]|nr:hypothetical protein [Hydrogenibacillus schlegelii]